MVQVTSFVYASTHHGPWFRGWADILSFYNAWSKR